MKRITLATLLLWATPTLFGQNARTPPKVVYAVFTESPITIDGELNEPAWQRAQPATDFIQRDPSEGEPSSERTEVRILYDADNLYIGVYCYDRTPERITVRDIGRDFLGYQQDVFGILLDTFNDDRSGFSMATTPRGGQADVQILDETRDLNFNWDGVWSVQSRIQKDGWSAEFVIPFKTLRFREGGEQIWGIQFYRLIRHRNEMSWWNPVARRYVGWYVSLGGELRGLENIRQGRNLKVKPYFLGGAEKFGSQEKDVEKNLKGGVDIKYGLTPGLTLDLSGNTDFSQVEADVQQINLTRFPLFFPEKREFFLENAGIFRLGETYQIGVSRTQEVIPFFSRRIGLSEAREPLPIFGGARLTGRAGPYYLGFLNMQTRSSGDSPANNFTVARVRRDFSRDFDLGVLSIQRQSGQARDHNRTYGADVNLRFFRDLKINGVLAKTETPGRRGDDWYHKVEAWWQNNLIRYVGMYSDAQPNFNPEVGFVRRPGRRILHNELGLRPRLRRNTRWGSVIREFFPLVISDYAILPNGDTETKLLQSRLRIEFQDGGNFETQYTQNFERTLRPFEIRRHPTDPVLIPAGDYRFNQFQVSYTSNPSKSLAGEIRYGTGDFYSGEKRTWNLAGKVQLSYRFSAQLDYERNDIDLREKSFSTDLVGLNLDYSFNPRTFLNALIQYNSETHQVSSNIRFRLIHRSLSDFYIVYNEQRDVRLARNDRSVALKYTHLLDF
ncbi:MAG: carbohydrate binding family 9 domain-containing protein [Acidobacteria bacterium]|nr:carbohydrate binding family 9 domain-containing protein [Acidobacteriota bacterium]